MLNNKIKVYARIKPSSDSRHHHCEIKVNRSDKKKILLLHREYERNSSNLQTRLHEHEEFIFENVFTENASQEIIYNSMAKPVVERAIEGFNGTIMAYGQTGTGKTHTICGGPDLSMKGIIPRAFKHVFHRMKEMKQTNFKVYLSAMEIYNDHAFDLLSEKITKFGLPRVNSKQIIPRNLKMAQVFNMHELGRLLKRASCNRVVRNTGMNDASSRSHCIFSLHLYQYQATSGSGITKSKIHMIDLSGSEKIGKKRPSGILFNESRHINLSLHYIELVIRALSDKSQDHIPYRNSMITSFLRDSLGGNSNTVMIFTLSLDPMFFEETVLTCRFAQRVSLISNKTVKSHKSQSSDAKKAWRTGEVRKSKHKGINCKLEGSDSSLSLFRDDTDEVVNIGVIANLKVELEESKRMISELSNQLQIIRKTSVTPSTPVRNGFRSTPLEREPPGGVCGLNRNETYDVENYVSLTELLDSPKVKKSLLKESKGCVCKRIKHLCSHCGKRMHSFKKLSDATTLTDTNNYVASKGAINVSQDSQSLKTRLEPINEIKSKILGLENGKLKSFAYKASEQEYFSIPENTLENDEMEEIISGTKLSLSKHSNLDASNCSILQMESNGSKPLMYFIYELIGLSLPSKNSITGKPYDSKEIEKFCEFVSSNLNIQRFKKQYYDRHCELVEKEFQGCYKLNKMISSVEKLKLKLNEMKYCSEANLEEREELEKLIQVEDNKLNHGKAMLEVIRNERLELLKSVKKLRASLISFFHINFLELNSNAQRKKIGKEQSVLIDYRDDEIWYSNNIYSKRSKILTELRKQNKNDSFLKNDNENLSKSTYPIKSMPDISLCKSNKLNAKLSHCSTNIRIISRSDTVINSFKLPRKTISTEDIRISSSPRVKKRTNLTASEESYSSFISGANSLDPSSGVFSLSEGPDSVGPRSDILLNGFNSVELILPH